MKDNLEHGAWPLVDLASRDTRRSDRSALARAIAYKLSLVGLTNELNNKQPQQSHHTSHQAS